MSIAEWMLIAATTLLAACLVLPNLLADARPLEAADGALGDFAEVFLPISDFFVTAIVFISQSLFEFPLRHALVQAECQTAFQIRNGIQTHGKPRLTAQGGIWHGDSFCLIRLKINRFEIKFSPKSG